MPLPERRSVQERMLSEVRGRMLEDIVLLETKVANPEKQLFVPQFPVGEFDMVVSDPEEGSCELFEIKHAAETTPRQYRHLLDKEKCAQTEHRFGPVAGTRGLRRDYLAGRTFQVQLAFPQCERALDKKRLSRPRNPDAGGAPHRGSPCLKINLL